MKTTHITKVCAVVMAMLMLLSMVPASVLPVFAVSSEGALSIFDTVTLGKGTVTNTENYKGADYASSPNKQDSQGNTIVNDEFSPYEPYWTNDDEHPFLMNGSAWIDLSKIYYGVPATPNVPTTKWSANTSVVNITGTGKTYGSGNGILTGTEIYAIHDHNLVDEYLWAAATETVGGKLENGVVQSDKLGYAAGTFVESKNSNKAYVYNRYDAMQGKWGLTLDKNVSYVTWSPTYVENAYGTDKHMDNSFLYLSDTPYLFYSTEAVDDTQMAISLLIGTPVQSERKASNSGMTTVSTSGNYEFRWYTITDNSARPGVGNDTLNNSMVPLVTVSDVVLDKYKLTSSSEDILAAISDINGDNVDPIKVAENAGIDTEKMYVSGAITGCIDFTQLLPLVMGMGHGREDVKYKIAQIRVDTKTKSRAATDSAARINYMYFGPGQAAIYTPQSTVGSDVSGMNWMYAQNDGGIGDQNPNYVATTSGYYIGNYGIGDKGYDSGYTNGWHNGQAVSITNTPNTPQLMTIDTYGKSGGTLISYADYTTEMTNYYKANGAVQDSESGNWYYEGMPLTWLTTFPKGSNEDNSMIWKYTDVNGVTQYLEAEYNEADKNYYIMVTVPVRKWVNVLGYDRKLSMNVKMLQYGVKSDGKTQLKVNPSFCFWANVQGALGAHSSIDLGVRHNGEDMIGTFGMGYYNVDCANNNPTAFVDHTLGESVVYNTGDKNDASTFDWLRSPYTYPMTVTSENSTYGLDAEMIGYSFITSMRFVMPIGSKMSLQSIKGDGNAAGLNEYSTSGEIVSAYDGGTGIQPEINVSNTINAHTVTNNDGTFTRKQDGTLKGTQTNGAAAYGPMLEESRYTIYDMLDTEWLNEAGNSSHDKNKLGRNNMTVYGQSWYPLEGQLPILHSPSTTEGVRYGYTYGNSCEFVVYATVIFTDESNSKWGIVGVLTSSGTPEIGFVRLWDGSKAYAKAGAGTLYGEYKMKRAEYSNWSFVSAMAGRLKNEWILSNFIGTYSDFQDANYGNVASHDGANPGARDVYAGKSSSAHFGGPQLKYANMWVSTDGGSSTYKTLKDTNIIAQNTTDMEISFTRKNNKNYNWSIGMTRVFQTPITLHANKAVTGEAVYPVFYYDYETNANIADGNDSNTIALSIRVDGTDYLYYLYGEGSGATNKLTTSYRDGHSGNAYGYFSFKDLMTNTFKGKTVQIVGINFYFWRATSANLNSDTMTIRRMEIWQGENDWYDKILSTDSSNMTAKIKDSVHIINDSFFNAHNETKDGSYTIERVNTSDGKGVVFSGTGINESLGGFDHTVSDNTKAETVTVPNSQKEGTAFDPNATVKIERTTSYRKSNSNKGWSARIQSDTNEDGVIDEKDNRVYSWDMDSSTSNGVEGLYEYQSSVGHLRVWVPSQGEASVVFEADRSFNTKNYRYLYYSYSMRDVKTGISAEDKSANGRGSGVCVAVKGTQNTSDMAYLEKNGSWEYYPDDNSYWANNTSDNREYNTTMTAALDLSTLKIKSVNQIVFYLRNLEGNQAEFYINYIYLSNVPPTELISSKLEQVQTQYYYMMDNTGDRYSARFPTIDNPTGQVSGTNADNDRTNPIKIERGQLLSTGTYFNGDRLYGYGGTSSTDRTFDEDTASEGYYEKTYGNDSNPNGAENGSMKNIMFYAGGSNADDDLTDIKDFYDYKDRGRIYTYIDANGNIVTETVEADGVGDIYDMMWSYGRWFTGDGSNAMNIMYVGDPNAPDYQQNDGNYRKDSVSGGLNRRYATENYVLLRSGITPKKYETYFDADGGEFIYEGSSEDTANLHKVNENSYFLTQNVILSHYIQPGTKDFMAKEEPQKPGYTFKYWQKIQLGATDTVDTSLTDAIKNEFPGTEIADGELTKYTRKDKAQVDYFKAVWEKDPNAKNTTATFNDNNGNEWFERKTNIESEGGSYVLQIPAVTNLVENGITRQIYGWKIKGGDENKVFAPGDRLYLLEDVEFIPVLDVDPTKVFQIKLTGAQLYVHTVNGRVLKVQHGDHGISVEKSTQGKKTVYTYENVPANYHVRAVPDVVDDNGKWTDASTTGGDKYQFVSSVVVSANKDCFDFGVYEDRSLTYTSMSSLDAFYTAQDGILATNTSQKIKDSNEVSYYGKFEAPAGATVKAYGTLFTVQKYFDLYDTSDDAAMADLNKHLRLDDTTVNATTVKNKNYAVLKPTAENESKIKTIKFVQADACTEDGEFLFTITGTNTLQTYYARTYVIYTMDGGKTYEVAYGDVVSVGVTDPAA